MNDEDN